MIDDDPLICEVLRKALHNRMRAVVECALTGAEGVRMLAAARFHLVVIDARLPDIPGTALADIAADDNVPSLLLSGHPETQARLARFAYPYLAKPFVLNEFTTEASRILSQPADNILQVRAASARLRAGVVVLMSAMVESRRLMAESRARRGG